MMISISFKGLPGSEKDKLAHSIFKTYNGEFQGAGTMLDVKPERDMQYKVSKLNAKDCKEALKAAGFDIHGQ